MVTENPPVFPQELRDCDSSILARQVDSLKLLTGLSFFLAISTRRDPIIYVAYIDGKLESSFVKLKSSKRGIVYALQPDWRKHEINNEILSQNPAESGLEAGFEKSHKSINQAATSMIWDMEINYYFLLKGKQLWRI